MALKDFFKEYQSIVSVFMASSAAFGIVLGAVSWVDSRYAKAASLSELEDRVELNELKDQLRNAREELFFWRQQSRKYPEDQDVAQSLKDAEDQVTKIKEEIKQLERKDT